jgi:hypothetical protein
LALDVRAVAARQLAVELEVHERRDVAGEGLLELTDAGRLDVVLGDLAQTDVVGAAEREGQRRYDGQMPDEMASHDCGRPLCNSGSERKHLNLLGAG